MDRKNLIVFFIAVLFLLGHAVWPRIHPKVFRPLPILKATRSCRRLHPTAAFWRKWARQNPAATQPPLSGETAKRIPVDIQGSFPVAPDSQMASPGSNDPNDPSGDFTIQSQSSMDAVVKYYANELPKQGWTLRYTDANFTGGVNNSGKKIMSTFHWISVLRMAS